MVAQYMEIKAEYPDALLFYRMGDFYEMFFEDAVAAAEALDIALTKRGKRLGEDIPMCGVPVHSAEGYFLTLIRKGFRVAVCEQLEDPAEARRRGPKAVVKRGVTRLVTPGTLTEDTLLEARQHNFLAAYSEVRDKAALAWVDISTGAFHVMPCQPVRLGPELARLAPRELLLTDEREPDCTETASVFGISVTPLSRASFDSTAAVERLKALFSVGSLDAYGNFGRAELSAMGAIVDYLELTQRGKLPLLRPPRLENAGRVMQIDAATRRNLELTRSLAGGRAGSLLSAIDRTVTAGGARLLELRISSPSLDLSTIHARQDAVASLVNKASFAGDIREALRQVPDMDRALSRLSLDRAGPRDLAAIRDGLVQTGRIAGQLAGEDLPDLLKDCEKALIGFDDLATELLKALVTDPPHLLRDGGFITAGYEPELDESRKLRDEGRGVIAKMQSDYGERTGIQSLKIKHNNVLGYFIEAKANRAERMMSEPLSETFIHRQTISNAVRFTTVELSELETRILNAGAHALEIEKRLYLCLKDRILDRSDAIHAAARALAELDAAACLADVASSENWCRPRVDDSRIFDIRAGRHPVVEMALREQGGKSFVANDCRFDPGDGIGIWLLTGPNMSGKSTFLRQNALIALLAQTGSYVPAKEACIGLVSQLFSRVGASDDLARGRSTFMVEMVETAAILNQADDRAFVILDEIGRGTSTYDGLSIAWATLEHLHEKNRCRSLFATHYHEMTQLADKLSGVGNATVAVKEWEGEIIFLHEVRMGAADRSYGVQVAKLAGLPPGVVERARVVLAALEEGEREGASQRRKALIDDLPLFSAAPTEPAGREPAISPALVRLSETHPDDLTARQALDLIYELKALAEKSRNPAGDAETRGQ